MSSKEQDLKDAIKGAKNKYAGIDRIIFQNISSELKNTEKIWESKSSGEDRAT